MLDVYIYISYIYNLKRGLNILVVLKRQFY